MLSEMQLRLREECDIEDCGNNDPKLSMENIIFYGTFEDLCMVEMEICG